MIHRFFLYILCLLVTPFYAYGADQALSALEDSRPASTKDNNTTEISGFLINIRGVVGYGMPAFQNTVVQGSPITPISLGSPIEGGGGVSIGARFAVTAKDIPTPAYMRVELEYIQRAPYSFNGSSEAYSITNRGGTPDPILGYDESKLGYDVAKHNFKLRSGTQTLQLGIFIDVAATSIVVPYAGVMLGLSVYDIQLSAPTVEYFTPVQSNANKIYGNIDHIQARQTEASFLWGFATGIIVVINDYISFDLGIKYTNNMTITVGRPGTMEFKLKNDFIETVIGMNITL